MTNKKKITKEEALSLMKNFSKDGGEVAHMNGDDLLVQIIQEYLPEFKEITELFDQMEKWYS